MKKVVVATAAAVLVLLLISLTRAHSTTRHRTQGQTKETVAAEPTDVARDYLTSLFSGDVRAAEAMSTPLLARQLETSPPHPNALGDRPTSMDVFTLDRAPTTADIAVELHWARAHVAALRVQLVFVEDDWRVAGVQP